VHFGTVGGGDIGFVVVGGVGADVTGGNGGLTVPPAAGEPDASLALDAVEPDDPFGPADPLEPEVVAAEPTAPSAVAAESGGPPTTLP
jgi:hypothetical protein